MKIELKVGKSESRWSPRSPWHQLESWRAW